MAVYEIELPLPPAECGSNWHGHWAKKAKAVKAYRAECAWLFKLAKGAQSIPCPLPFVTVHMDFYQCRIKGDLTRCISHDQSNAIASAKSLQDALQDAGIVETDSRKHVKQGEVNLFNLKKQHQGRRCVVVRLETANC